MNQKIKEIEFLKNIEYPKKFFISDIEQWLFLASQNDYCMLYICNLHYFVP